jgi:hypothetical protein
MDSKRKTVIFLKLKRENLSTGGLGFKELMERVEYHTSNATQVAYRTLVDEIKQGYKGDANDVGAYREYLLSTIMRGERRPIIEHASDDDFMMNFIDLILKEELMTPQATTTQAQDRTTQATTQATTTQATTTQAQDMTPQVTTQATTTPATHATHATHATQAQDMTPQATTTQATTQAQDMTPQATTTQATTTPATQAQAPTQAPQEELLVATPKTHPCTPEPVARVTRSSSSSSSSVRATRSVTQPAPERTSSSSSSSMRATGKFFSFIFTFRLFQNTGYSFWVNTGYILKRFALSCKPKSCDTQRNTFRLENCRVPACAIHRGNKEDKTLLIAKVEASLVALVIISYVGPYMYHQSPTCP